MTKQSTLLFVFTFLISTCLLAQQRQFKAQPLNKVRLTEMSFTELEQRMELDTLFPPAFADVCALEPTALLITDAWGRVGGMNEFLDREKAQLINNTTNTTITITETLVFFNRVSVVGNGNLRAKIYAVGSDGYPADLLGQSDDIAADEIQAVDTALLITSFPFSTPVMLDAPAFIVSIDLSDLYVTNDTTDIIHTDVGCGSGVEAFELWSDDTWNTMQEAWSNDGSFNINFNIFPVVEFEAPSAVNDPFYQEGHLRLHPATPNPARRSVQLHYDLEKAGAVSIEIYSADGRQLQKRVLGQMPSGRHTELIALDQFTEGAYIYSILTDEARVVSRFVVN